MPKKEVLDVLDTKEPITRVYLVRHGQTKANKENLIFGQWDIPLNSTGEKQARNAAKNLLNISKKNKISTIISSPLLRTRQTAEIISKKLEVKKINIEKDIIEKSEGAWEGKSYWDVRKTDSKNYFKWLSDPYRRCPPGGETVVELNKRIERFKKNIIKKYRGKNIIVVSHSGPIRMLVLNILKTPLDKYWNIKVENGSITELRLSKTFEMIWAVNRVS